MPARVSRATWRTSAAALPALVLSVGLVWSLPGTAAQASPRPPAASERVLATPVADATAAIGAPIARGALLAAAARAQHARAAAPLSRAMLVLREAAALAGRPYVYGAAGPRSFDCSGFTRYVFATVGRYLPHNAAAQFALSHKIAKSAIRPGDLVFFVSYGYIYHVAIYAGHGLIWHAPHSGDHVRLATISTNSWVAGRVL